MREIAEFRVVEEFASRLFRDDEGKTLEGSGIRKVLISTSDPRYSKIGRLNNDLGRERDRSFFHGWDIIREYTAREISSARLLQLVPTAFFEPAGEECGTEYDEAAACPECRSGAPQVSSLRLDLRKAPKSKDVACTIGSELIISQRLAEKITVAGLTGFELQRVRHKARYEDDPIDLRTIPAGQEIIRKAEREGISYSSWQFSVWLNEAHNDGLFAQAQNECAARHRNKAARRGKPLPTWYQFVATSQPADIVPPTRVGIDPFDDDLEGRCRCPRGDLLGLNLLSEVSVSEVSYDGADFVITRQFIGTRRGVLRPRQLTLVSQKMWQLLSSEKAKGAKCEVVHLVTQSA